MRNRHLVIRALAPLAVFGMVVACGGDGSDTGAPATGETAEMPFDVATAGNVSGMVMFEGEAPGPQPLDMSSESSCQAHWDGSPTREDVKVRNGHLADVFIYVKEGLEGMNFPTHGQAVVVDQVGCRYTPPVVGVMVGQNLTFRNSDGLLHNVNATPATNRPFNISQPVNMDTQRTFPQPEVMIPVRCDVHGWMRAYVGVVSHPYYGVTGEPGTFSLQDLPPGEYVIEAWHSQLGVQEQTITVATGETAQVSFTYTAEMLQSAVVPLGDPIDPHNHNPLMHRVGQGNAEGHAHAPATAPGTR
jgi:plastocyanin